MPLVFTEAEARFEDVCTVEDALPLLEFLKDSEAPQVDLSACTYLHTALLQLPVCPPPSGMAAPPADPALRGG